MNAMGTLQFYLLANNLAGAEIEIADSDTLRLNLGLIIYHQSAN